ncbi:MAG TPA: hypothetical protein VGM39_17285 [Kofleriaceae bacterium]|jgi:hypothetical protein
MRTAIFSLLFVSACATTATGPRPINVALVRHEIDDTIQTSSKDRHVTSMGKTTADHAVVYTTLASGGRQEESWTKTGGAWKMDHATVVSAN